MLLKDRFWIGLIGLTLVGALAGAAGVGWADRILMASYMPLFLAGVATWLAVYERKAVGWWMLALALACYFPAVPRFDLRQHAYAPWMLNACVLGLGGAFIGLMAIRVKLSFAPLAWVGRISYSLYLVHQVIGVSLIAKLHEMKVTKLISVATSSLVVVALAWTMFRFVEEPGRRLLLRGYRTLRDRTSSPAETTLAAGS